MADEQVGSATEAAAEEAEEEAPEAEESEENSSEAEESEDNSEPDPLGGRRVKIAEDDDRLYVPAPGEEQLTFRAVFVGCLLGGLIAAMNIYFGLRTGWSIGGSLIAAILGVAFFNAAHRGLRVRGLLGLLGRLIGADKRRLTVLEANIIQTSGSGAGTMTSAAGLLAAIPALGMLGTKLSYLELTLWAASVASLGIFFAVPLRRQMILTEKLRFPTGTATANTLMAMLTEGGDTTAKARTLLFWALGAAAFTLLAYFFPEAGMPPLKDIPWPMVGVTATSAGVSLFALLWGLSFRALISPLMFGAGILIGFRVAASLAAGAIVSWGILGPLAQAEGWVEGPFMSYQAGARGWILWPGVAIMVADALTSLGLSWRTILRTFSRKKPASQGQASEDPYRGGAGTPPPSEDEVPTRWWIAGLGVGATATVLVSQLVFHIPWWMSLIAVALSSILASIAVRSTGETDINPIGGMGKVTQLVFGGIAPGSTTTNLMAAGIAGAGASQAGDMMHDLKSGYLLGASPRKQVIAQLCGVLSGIFFAVPIYKLFDAAYDIGGEEVPAPAAHAWKAMAELLANGFDSLPAHAPEAILGGLLFGALIPILRKALGKERAKYLPSGLAFGIAFIVPAYYSLAMFFGALVFLIWKKRRPEAAEKLGFSVASGLIAGEGLMGIVTAILTLLGITAITGGGGH